MPSKVKPLVTPASSGGEFETVPAGVYLARCYKMIDLGTQPAKIVNGKKFKAARKIMLYWELLQNDKGEDVFMEDGESVFSISNEYTWSMFKTANLRKTLDSWRGTPFTDKEAEGFEISKLLGVFCKLQVVHNKSGDRVFANVGAIMSTEQPKDLAVNELATFSIEDPDMEMFESFPDWIKDKIREAIEWKVETQDGDITPEGDIKIEDVDDPEDGVNKEELSKLF